MGRRETLTKARGHLRALFAAHERTTWRTNMADYMADEHAV
ncbi:MAG: hypothetical protein ABSB76_32910 [Streptosporangiaceae bacterium]